MDDLTLLPDVDRPPRRYEVMVTMPRDDGDELVPPGGHALAELAAAAVCAEGLVTAWTYWRAVLVMTVDLPCEGDALAAGVAVAKALGRERGVSVTVEPAPA